MKITTVSKLKLGQRFQWIPNAWYGTGKLIYKARREQISFHGYPVATAVSTYIYDLEYDAAVVNPPAIIYGVPGSTKVRLLKKGERYNG
jgi:hypothetical protein